MTRKAAEQQLNYVRGLRIRLLGDRVLQNVAWKAASLIITGERNSAPGPCQKGRPSRVWALRVIDGS